jgi:TPR repeat protein
MWENLPEQERFPHIRVWLGPRRFGERLARNPQAGAAWVRAAALRGSAEAQLGWGHMLLDGHGVVRDEAAALRWFRLAAQQGNLDATNMVGRCYELGWGTEADPANAAHWYGLAAAKSHDWAQFNLAALILAGTNEATEVRRAVSLLVASARAGNPKAMNMLGHCREQGWAGPCKQRAAALWFRRAAERGCFRGQFHHARFLLRDGKTPEACRWLRSSLRNAPPDFAREAAAMLRQHPSPHVRSIVDEVCGSGKGHG